MCEREIVVFNSESAAARPKLKLLPRTVKDPVNTVVQTERNASIFGKGKPREEGNILQLVVINTALAYPMPENCDLYHSF